MLSKQETIELLRYPIYKVELRLLHYPYVGYGYAVEGKRIYNGEHDLCRKLFRYIHTQESIRQDIFVKGHIIYWLHIKDDEVYEVDTKMLAELGCTLKVGISHLSLGLADNGNLYQLN